MKGYWPKRLGDILAVVLTAPLWLPLLGLVSLLVRLKLGSPVFFRQQRPGYRAVVFELIKFRTMTDGRDDTGRLLPDASRLTPFGAWLRSTSLDELPELLNVLRGEMSLVGPRPLLVEYLPRYSVEQRRRHEVPPGLTGWAQINGRNSLPWEEKFKLDIWYVDHRGFWLDLRILFRTVWQVVTRHGISAAGDPTMPEFRPNAKPGPDS
jgi:sugar transferase EpsL